MNLLLQNEISNNAPVDMIFGYCLMEKDLDEKTDTCF